MCPAFALPLKESCSPLDCAFDTQARRFGVLASTLEHAGVEFIEESDGRLGARLRKVEQYAPI